MPDADTQFDRDLRAARDRSIASLRQVADHRRIEILARNINACLQGESQADGLLALTKVLGVFLRASPPAEQITAIAMIDSLLTNEILGTPDHDA